MAMELMAFSTMSEMPSFFIPRWKICTAIHLSCLKIIVVFSYAFFAIYSIIAAAARFASSTACTTVMDP